MALLQILAYPDPRLRKIAAPVAAVTPDIQRLIRDMANGGEAAWKSFLTNQYHHPNDDLSQPIHWQSGARFAELNYRAVRILADGTEAPRWFAGDYFGNLFAPNKTKAARQ